MPSFTVFKADKNGKIFRDTTTRPNLTGDQVFVRITASGLCGTDVHARQFQEDIVLGHEGVGVVEMTGPNVLSLKKGDRVGWGYIFSTCGHCYNCLRGQEQFCPEREFYINSNQDLGSMGSHSIIREAFLFRIPDGITDKEAAPLMCGGATTFSALFAQGIKPTSRVGIIGVGGLGHLAIQFASKMGCEVVVFSGTDGKDEALKLGASHFIVTKGKSDLASDLGSVQLDFVLVTASMVNDWDMYYPIMATQCKIIPLTVTNEDFAISQTKMVMSGWSIHGSLLSNRTEHRMMLDFADRHGIRPILNEFPMTVKGIEAAFDALEKGEMRYRGVLVPQ